MKRLLSRERFWDGRVLVRIFVWLTCMADSGGGEICNARILPLVTGGAQGSGPGGIGHVWGWSAGGTGPRARA